MTLYESIQYLQYRWKAKGRHGTHSPFVYDFVEKVLRAENKDGLLANMLHYFQFNTIEQHSLASPAALTSHLPPHPGIAPVLVFDKLQNLMIYSPEIQLITTLLAKMSTQDVLLIQPIHKTGQQTQIWEEIKNAPNVKLTMDLFDLGIVFFRKEFREKQHFILK